MAPPRRQPSRAPRKLPGLAYKAANAMAHDLEVRIKLRYGATREGFIVRREARDAPSQDGSTLMLHLDDGGGPISLNDVDEILTRDPSRDPPE